MVFVVFVVFVVVFFVELVVNREIRFFGEAAFLVSGPLLKIVVNVGIGKVDRSLLADAEPGDTSEGREIEDAVTMSSLDRLQEDGMRDFSRQGKQFSRESMPLRHAWSSQCEVEIFAHPRIDRAQPLFFQASFFAKTPRLKRRRR